MDKHLMIEGRGVCKTFKDFWGRPKVEALKNLDITVPEGVIYGLLGPNGAGKSTLIKLILGHLYTTSGTVRVIGENPRDVDVKRRIGYVPERTSLYANLTAIETLTFFGRLLGIAESDITLRSVQLLKMVGLEHMGKRFVGEFSNGMRKRLALAQALINDPDLLLLDEPTAGLDPIGCREIKDLIITLGKRGKTIVMTSHLLADIQDVSDRIMIIYGGEMQAEGTVDELLAKKDEILIKSSTVSDTVMEQVKELLGSESASPVDISFPKRSLEEYFLSVVAKATTSGGSTSGAEMGEGVADYLKSGLDKEAVEAITKDSASTGDDKASVVDKDLLEDISRHETEQNGDDVDKDAISVLTKKD